MGLSNQSPNKTYNIDRKQQKQMTHWGPRTRLLAFSERWDWDLPKFSRDKTKSFNFWFKMRLRRSNRTSVSFTFMSTASKLQCSHSDLIEQGLTSHQTHCRSYRGRFLQVIWPNQQCQSTEGSHLVFQIRPESHQGHSTMLQYYNSRQPPLCTA